MDPHKTAPFELGPEQAKHRVLLVHGFTGSPWDVRPLAEALAKDGFFVKGIRLPGHGTTPAAMTTVSARDWELAVESALRELSADGPVHMAGLSMGALLSVISAARHPLWVRSLMLMAPAMQFIGPSMTVVRAARKTPLIELLHPWQSKTSTDIQNDQMRNEAPVLGEFPTARLRDLFKVQDTARKLMSLVQRPALIACADEDHVVSVEGGRELARGLRGPVRMLRLSRGFHILPRDNGCDVLFDEAKTFLGAYSV